MKCGEEEEIAISAIFALMKAQSGNIVCLFQLIISPHLSVETIGQGDSTGGPQATSSLWVTFSRPVKFILTLFNI